MKNGRRLLTSLAVGAALAAAAAPACAELKAMSPLSPANGFPVWYQDTNSLSTELCLDPNDPFCGVLMAPLPNPNAAVSFPGNFPDEAFWWTGDAAIPLATGGEASLVLAMEAAFANGPPASGDQISFGRIRVNMDTPVTGTYRITHPFGVMVIDVGIDPQTGLPAGIKNEGRDIGASGVQFIGVLDPAQNDTETAVTPDMFRFGPFLRWTDPDFPVTDPISGKRYLGNPGILHAVTGSPFGTNFFRVEGPPGSNIGGPGVDVVETGSFLISGKLVGMGVTPFPTAAVTTLVGTPALTQVTVSNITGGPLSFTGAGALAITGPQAADFSIVPGGTDTCSGETLQVPPATPSECSFEVAFAPAASTVAARNATLTITPDDPATAPPVSVNLAGTAQYQLTVSAGGNGSFTNVNGIPTVSEGVNAGGSKSYRVTPNSGYFPLVKVNGARQAVAADNTVTLAGIGENKTVAATFLRNGDLNADDAVSIGDVVRALQISVGIGAAASDEETVTADVGPLANNAPKASGAVDISDVMVILRRAVGLEPLW